MFMALKKRKKKALIGTVIGLIILAMLIIVAPMTAETIDNSFSISSHTEKAPVMVAHRGLSSLAPQNSLPAFELSAEYGFDGCEFDIHTTKDGEWVVIHDDTVDAMTNGEGTVADFTLEEIRALTLDSGNGIENYGSLTVPTLREALEVCKKGKVFPVIEIKGCDTKYLPSLKETVEELGLKEDAVFISFEREYLEKYRELDGDAQMLLLSSTVTDDDIEWCITHGAGINFFYGNFYKSAPALKTAREKGIKIGVWTVDNTVFEDIMVLFGAEIITTNKLLP